MIGDYFGYHNEFQVYIHLDLSVVKPTFIYSIFQLKVVRAMRSNTTAMFLCVFGEKVSIKILYNTYWYAVRLMILSCHVYTDFFDIRLQDQT